jgi:hypothetical protein
VLSVGSPQTGITSSYDATTGVLTLTGDAILTTCQTELDSVTFASASALNASSRTISWSVSDCVDPAALATSSAAVFVSNSDLDIGLQSTSGELALWQVTGAALSAASLVGGTYYSTDWFEVGTGAFYSGDTSDILWQDTDGTIAVWQEQGATLVSSGTVLDPGPSWHVKGTGDFYGDGKTDICCITTMARSRSGRRSANPPSSMT